MRASGATFRRRASDTTSLAATALLGAAALTMLAVAARADDPAAPSRNADVVSQEIDVTLAEIEAAVTDRQGEPVAGLTRDDFRVFQDGREVELTHFSAVGGGRPTPDDAAPEIGGAAASPAAAPGDDPDGRLNLVIYVDRGYLEPGDLRDVRPALKDFLRHALGPGDRVMLVAAGPSSLETVQAFTSVPELVIEKLDAVREQPGGGRLAREGQDILAAMRRSGSQSNDLLARDPGLQAHILVSRIQAYAAEIDGDVRRTTGQLRRLTQSIAGLPGRRAVIYVSGRVPVAYARRLFEAWEDAFTRAGLGFADDPETRGAGGDADRSRSGLDSPAAAAPSFVLDPRRSIEAAAETASAHGVVFHTLDVGGRRDASVLRPGATVPARSSFSNPGAVMAAGTLADAGSGLRALALGTGGRDAAAGGRDVAVALARIGSDLGTYYSLGFQPLPSDGGSSRIEVRLTDGDGRGKLQVRHRTVLQLKDLDTLAVERTVSALLLEDIDNPLGVEVSAGEPAASAQDTWRVPVSITVPLANLALVADGRVHAGRLSIYVVTGGLDRIESVTKAVVPVRIPNRELLTSLGRRTSYNLELDLSGEPDAARPRPKIAVTVRDDFRPRSSTAVTTAETGELESAGGPPEPGPR